MTAASCSARHRAAVHQPAPAVCAGGRLLCFPVRERRRAVQGRALHRRKPMPRALAEEMPTTCGTAATAGRGHALGPELRLSDGARPRYAGPHPIYRQPLQRSSSDPSEIPRGRSSRCRSTCMRAWKSTRTALCRAGSRPTAPWQAVLDRHDHRQQGCRRRVALPRAGLRP